MNDDPVYRPNDIVRASSERCAQLINFLKLFSLDLYTASVLGGGHDKGANCHKANTGYQYADLEFPLT